MLEKKIVTTVASIIYNKYKQKIMGRDRPINFSLSKDRL